MDDQKEIPQEPHLEQKASSIWDTFDRNRIAKPRDIAKEEKERATTEERGLIAEVQTKEKAIIDGYSSIYDSAQKYAMDSSGRKVIKPGGEDSYKMIAQFEDANTTLRMKSDYWKTGWAGDEIEVQIEEKIPLQGEDKRIPRNFLFGEVVIPEFFKIDGQVWEHSSTYELNVLTNEIKVKNLIFVKNELYSYFSRKKVTTNIEDIPELDPNARTRLNINDDSTWLTATRLPNEGDYEQLQSALVEIRLGDLSQPPLPVVE